MSSIPYVSSEPTISRLALSVAVALERRPHGLKGDLVADQWEFESGQRHKAQSIAWTRVMANGHALNAPENSAFWELARRFFTVYRNGTATRNGMAVSTCITATYILFQIIDAVIRSGAQSLWEFQARHLDDLLVAVAGLTSADGTSVFVRGTVQSRLDIVRQLYLLVAERDGEVLLNDGFSFSPFHSAEDVRAFAKKISLIQGETPDAPPQVVFPLLNAALEYVAYYSDDIIRLQNAAQTSRPGVEERCRADYRPRFTRRQEIAAALLASLNERPNWVDATGKIQKSELARHLGMNPADAYKTRYVPLYVAAELLLSGRASTGASKARSLLTTEANRTPARKTAVDAGPELARAIGLPFSGSTGKHAPWPLVHVGAKKGSRMGLASAVNRLWTAAYVILASFMADRESETLAISTDCLIDGIDGCYIQTPNFKARNVEGGSLIVQPCPKAVELAVSVLLRLGEGARQRAGSTKLLCVNHHLGDSVPDVTELRKRLQLFADGTGTSNFNDDRWRLSPHQLRRFFVTSWINYYEFGRYFSALSSLLDHASIGTTIRYGTRVAQAVALSKGQKNLANRILTNVACGNIDAKGPVAQNFARFAERLNVRAVPNDQISDWVAERVDRNDCELIPMPHGYCVWSKTAGRHAGCLEKPSRRAGISRPQSRKKSCVCGNGCRNFLFTEVFGGFWEHSAERHRRVASNPAAPSRFREASRVGLRIATSLTDKIGDVGSPG